MSADGRPSPDGSADGTLIDMADTEGPRQSHDAAAALAAELVGLPLHDAIQRAEEEGFQVRTLAEGDVVTLEMNWSRVNLTRGPDGRVLRASRG